MSAAPPAGHDRLVPMVVSSTLRPSSRAEASVPAAPARGDTMMRLHNTRRAPLAALVTGTVALGLVVAAPVAGQDDAAAKIENAMSAAPSSVTEDATIMDNALDE